MPTKTKSKNKTSEVKKVKVMQSKKIQSKVDKFFDIQEEKKSAKLVVAVEKEVSKKKSLFEMLGKKTFLNSFFVLVILALLGISGYFYYQYKKVSAVDPGKDEIQTYVSKIEQFMVLPTDEQPTMATVADKEKLAGQAFFAKAENGDKVLFFAKSQKAILYRPSLNKIIEATAMSPEVSDANAQAPVLETAKPQEEILPSNAEDEKAQAEISTGVRAQASVFVENGTSKRGLAKAMAEKISEISGVTIVGTGNSVGNFEKTIVVDVSGKNEKIASEIANSLNGEVRTLPEGEKSSQSDIQVILGSE